MNRRFGILGAAALLGGLALGSVQSAAAQSAHSKEAYTEARFAELQQQGALILVDIWAEWCPTCAQQQKVLAAFREQHPDVKLHTLTVDFDRQKDVVRKFAAPRQSTLILYRGTERLWFSVAETRADQIMGRLLAAASGQ